MDQFKEEVVFEIEKDKPFNGVREFTYLVVRKYGFKPSSDLYRRVVNYQIEKYGTTANYPNWIDRRTFRSRSRRRAERDYQERKYKLEKLVERNG